MDYFEEVQSQIRSHLALIILFENALLMGAIWFGIYTLQLPLNYVALIAVVSSVIFTVIIASLATTYTTLPLRALWQAVMHLAPHGTPVAAPDINKLGVGRKLVSSLTAQIYQIISVTEHGDQQTRNQSPDLKANFVANNLPLPLFILDANQTVLFANSAAAEYVGVAADDAMGKNINSITSMMFPSELTFSRWLQDAQATKVTASQTWERVRIDVTDNQPTRLFDLAAYYNKGNSQQYEIMLILFDHTKTYSQDDQAISLIALGVHEIRTPLALLRGYIEAFDEETAGKLDEQLAGFMEKMKATSQQLTAFVNNILNVARIENDQLILKLHEEDWPSILKSTVIMWQLRAQVRGITLDLDVAENLPTVGADRISMQEVVGNLIDNAIKYSGKSKTIVIRSFLNSDSLVETSVQDWGVGIPTAVLSNLFTKFYRDHRNRAQIGGTGLGLYLCRTFIIAHGGNIWVESKEGTGSTFSFTLLPYARVVSEGKANGNTEIVRNAHGWIKNHSLYRR